MLWKQDNTISTGIIQAIDVVLSAMLILGAIRGVSGHMAPWILFDPGRQVAIFAYGVSEVLFYSGVQLPTPPPPSSSSSSSPPRPPQLTPGWPASLAVVYVCVALLNLFVHRVARKLYKSTMVAEDGGSQEMLQIAEGARYGATKGEF